MFSDESLHFAFLEKSPWLLSVTLIFVIIVIFTVVSVIYVRIHFLGYPAIARVRVSDRAGKFKCCLASVASGAFRFLERVVSGSGRRVRRGVGLRV